MNEQIIGHSIAKHSSPAKSNQPDARSRDRARGLALSRKYREEHVFLEYWRWWSQRKAGNMFMGNTYTKVFEKASRYMRSERVPKDGPVPLDIIERAVTETDAELQGQTAGPSAMYRACLLGASPYILDRDVPTVAASESRLTHLSPVSQDCCVAAALLVRNLVTGLSITDAVRVVLSMTSAFIGKEAIQAMQEALDLENVFSRAGLKNVAYSPQVLKNAIYIVKVTQNFTDARALSMEFTGGKTKYCSVLVGAFAAATYGKSNIHPHSLSHVPGPLLTSLDEVSDGVGRDWRDVPEPPSTGNGTPTRLARRGSNPSLRLS